MLSFDAPIRANLPANQRNQIDGETLLATLGANTVAACFFDPQYRGILDKLALGNEGARQRERALLTQMTDEQIGRFVAGIARALRPSGHLFLWLDKFHLVEGVARWWQPAGLEVVDHITWDKGRIGMGHRTRRRSEHLLILQKPPKRARGVWIDRAIPDVWAEPVPRGHAHAKPLGLIRRLMLSVTEPGDLILDPAAGGYGVLAVAQATGREFIGCDVEE